MNKETKIQKTQEIADKYQQSQAVIFTDYRGLNVEKINKLRGELRKVGVEYSVVKNTLMSRAVEGAEDQAKVLEQIFSGPTAATFGGDDPAKVAKILKAFAADFSELQIKGGLLERKALTKEQVNALATLPGKEVLIAMVLGGIQSPISGFVRTLNGVLQKFVLTLDAISQQKSASA
ncbi:MAG: 50S ribosomal protein L10 [Candidatus Schekmanbacteria bacterium]|nr:50S ribosomal protein L10 [Candidatus Schekmanbacteria bacterium]